MHACGSCGYYILFLPMETAISTSLERLKDAIGLLSKRKDVSYKLV